MPDWRPGGPTRTRPWSGHPLVDIDVATAASQAARCGSGNGQHPRPSGCARACCAPRVAGCAAASCRVTLLATNVEPCAGRRQWHPIARPARQHGDSSTNRLLRKRLMTLRLNVASFPSRTNWRMQWKRTSAPGRTAAATLDPYVVPSGRTRPDRPLATSRTPPRLRRERPNAKAHAASRWFLMMPAESASLPADTATRRARRDPGSAGTVRNHASGIAGDELRISLRDAVASPRQPFVGFYPQ